MILWRSSGAVDAALVSFSGVTAHPLGLITGGEAVSRGSRVLPRESARPPSRGQPWPVMRKPRIQAHKQAGIPVGKAIDAYAEQLRRNGLKERSIDTTLYRLRRLFGPVLQVPLPMVTPARAKDLFMKQEGSVDTRRNILNQARTFCRRAKENEWTDTILLADVKGEGKRRCGKQKLTVDESRTFLACRHRRDEVPFSPGSPGTGYQPLGVKVAVGGIPVEVGG